MSSIAHHNFQKTLRDLKTENENINFQWNELFGSIKSTSLQKLAQYVKPKNQNHILKDLYFYLLDAQETQTLFHADFWENTLYKNEYLSIDNPENILFNKIFQEQKEIQKTHFISFINYYLEHTKPYLITNSNPDLTIDAYHKIKTFILKKISSIYLKHINDFHHTIEEDGNSYLFTNKKFFPSYPHIHIVFDELYSSIEKYSSKLSDIEKTISKQFILNMASNQKFLYLGYFYLVNIFDEKESLKTLNHLQDFSYHSVNQLHFEFFYNSKNNTEEEFNTLNKKFSNLSSDFNFQSFWNPTLHFMQNDTNFSLNDTLSIIDNISFHFNELKKFNPHSLFLNNNFCLASPNCFNFENKLSEASFSVIGNTKFIECNFTDKSIRNSEILVHEYYHFFDSVLKEQITFPSKDIYSTHLSSTFGLDLQQIFTNNTYLAYEANIYDCLPASIKESYKSQFNNFLMAISKDNAINQNIVEKNYLNIQASFNLSNLVFDDYFNILIKNFTSTLLQIEFTNDIFTNVSKKICDNLSDPCFLNPLREKLYWKFHKSSNSSAMMTFGDSTFDAFNTFHEGFDDNLEKLFHIDFYTKDTIILSNKFYKNIETLYNFLFSEHLNFQFFIINQLVKFNPEAQEIFRLHELNADRNEDLIKFIYDDEFLKDFVTHSFINTVQEYSIYLKDKSTKITDILSNIEPVNYFVISKDYQGDRVFSPIPNIFNSTTERILDYSDTALSIYLSSPTEILARQSSVIFRQFKSNTNNSLVSKIKNIFEKDDDFNLPQSFIKKKFDNLYENYLFSHKNIIECNKKSIKISPFIKNEKQYLDFVNKKNKKTPK